METEMRRSLSEIAPREGEIAISLSLRTRIALSFLLPRSLSASRVRPHWREPSPRKPMISPSPPWILRASSIARTALAAVPACPAS